MTLARTANLRLNNSMINFCVHFPFINVPSTLNLSQTALAFHTMITYNKWYLKKILMQYLSVPYNLHTEFHTPSTTNSLTATTTTTTSVPNHISCEIATMFWRFIYCPNKSRMFLKLTRTKNCKTLRDAALSSRTSQECIPSHNTWCRGHYANPHGHTPPPSYLSMPQPSSEVAGLFPKKSASGMPY